MPYDANKNEVEILEFWQKNNIFEKSVKERPDNKPYVFYDGPPFATGLPHYGHILSSVIKDVVPRYWTMKGYQVRRRWGWDCHGLPIESLIEKELGISGKKDIEEKITVAGFNDACRSKVQMYTQEWKKMVDREGRWVEFDNAYKTMDPTYMESVWWALKTLWDKDKIYEGRKVLMYCTRCETPVSKAEIAMDNSYKDITEETATVKFKVKEPEKHGLPENTYILAWTTTPWTLPGNVALAVGPEVTYVKARIIPHAQIKPIGTGEYKVSETEYVILAKAIIERCDKNPGGSYIFSKENFGLAVEEEMKGSSLVGLEYEPLFDMSAMRETGKKAYYVAPAEFVTTEEGTGIVHTAVIYGEDDYNLGLKIDLPMVPMLDAKGHFNDVAPEFIRGEYLKKAEKMIKADLESRGLLFARGQHTHSYPHCWRCDTALIYNAISAWFIDIQSIKDKLIKLNEKIEWYPDHLKHGRFLNILETAPDWNISRNRYWATPLPFWKCTGDDCTETACIGSVEELKKRATNFDDVYSTDKVADMDLHKQFMDRVKLRCEKCEGEMQRIPEVIDCWVEAASMPFAEWHYPFENEKTFKERFPGQFIAEYIAQTRAWFYYMHVMGTLLFGSETFEHVVCTGTILNEKGEKLSKSKKNYTDPWIIIEQYGVDALRYYLMTSVVMQAENLFFNDREVRDIYNKVINILWNVVTFYQTYAGECDGKTKASESDHMLDRWILAKTQLLVDEVTTYMDAYNTVHAGRPIKEFIDELSTWYLRRSRDRFKGTDEKDKQCALATMREVLMTLSKVMAPFTPFIAEKMYREVGGKLESVHLEMWPEVNKKMRDKKVLEEMTVARQIVEAGLASRAAAGVKVRQVLGQFAVKDVKISEEIKNIIADELNVKQVMVVSDVTGLAGKWVGQENPGLSVALNVDITPELKKEGLVREIVRAINQLRKEQGYKVGESAMVSYDTDDAELLAAFADGSTEIARQTGTKSIEKGSGGTEITIDEKVVRIQLSR